MVAACRNERRLLTASLGKLEAENSSVELQRPLQIGDLQMDAADANKRVKRAGIVIRGHDLL
jgi:hypothetical protein